MAGKGNQPEIKPFENHPPGLPWNDPAAMRASQIVEARKLDIKVPENKRIPYSNELAEEICCLVAEGYTLKQISQREDMPHISMIYKYLANHKNFGDLYVRAGQIRLMSMAEEITEIADDGRNDWMERELKDGSIASVPDHEVVNRSKLRVDTRKWLLTKLMPKVYGEKVTLDINDKHAATLQAARARLAQRKAAEEKLEQSIDAQAVTLADDSTIAPADVQAVEPDESEIMDT